MSDIERRLKEFVDRKNEVARFERFFADPDKIVLAVTGPEGRGKSLLRVRLVKKCSDDGLPHAVLLSTNDDIHDFLSILHCCCENLGVTQFPRFTAALQPLVAAVDVNLRAGGNIKMLENAQIPGSVGAVTGMVLNNPQFTFAGAATVSPMERRRTITTEFLSDLRKVTVAAPLVIFLDAAEKMMPETLAWLWEKFVPALGQNEIRSTKIVFFSQIEPATESDAELYVEKTQLPPLDVPDIAEYLELKGLPKDFAALMKHFTKGEPLKIVQETERYKAEQAAQ
ncbi:MAG TPA: hypothetical protein VJ276_08415 [Thermoanaerobaculia bacterium]|nr:hypothetical protein [Thermoanaerobaculia bacterium]